MARGWETTDYTGFGGILFCFVLGDGRKEASLPRQRSPREGACQLRGSRGREKLNSGALVLLHVTRPLLASQALLPAWASPGSRGVRKGRVKAAGSGGGGWRKRSRGSAAATAAADATAAAVPDAAAPLPTAPLLFLLLVCEIGTCAWICRCHGLRSSRGFSIGKKNQVRPIWAPCRPLLLERCSVPSVSTTECSGVILNRTVSKLSLLHNSGIYHT